MKGRGVELANHMLEVVGVGSVRRVGGCLQAIGCPIERCEMRRDVPRAFTVVVSGKPRFRMPDLGGSCLAVVSS